MTAAVGRTEVLFDANGDLMIGVRGPVECDDGSEGYEIVIQSCVHTSGERPRPRSMRVPVDVWRAWVRAVGRLR